jgi:uncharacterized protein (DUF433 family)
MVTKLTIDEIISDPKIRRGRPVIAGTGLRVSDLVAWHKFGGIPIDELAPGFGLSLGQVYAAFAYYYLHQAEIADGTRGCGARGHRLSGSGARWYRDLGARSEGAAREQDGRRDSRDDSVPMIDAPGRFSHSPGG